MEDLFSNAVKRYLEIQTLQKQLEEEKNQLRKIIDKELNEIGHSVLVTDVGDTHVRIKKSERVKVSYNENLLRERLGNQYNSIISLDTDKIKKNQQQLWDILGEKTIAFSSPDRIKIKELIENKMIDPNAFKGAFTKEVKNILYVTSKPKNAENIPRENLKILVFRKTMNVDLNLKNVKSLKTSWLINTNRCFFEIYILKKIAQKDKCFFDELLPEMLSLQSLRVEEEGVSSVLLSLAQKGLVIYKMHVSKGIKRKFYRITDIGLDSLNEMIPIFETFVENYKLVSSELA